MISIGPKVGAPQRTDLLTGTPVPTLPSRAHPQDDVRRQATPSKFIIIMSLLCHSYISIRGIEELLGGYQGVVRE